MRWMCDVAMSLLIAAILASAGCRKEERIAETKGQQLDPERAKASTAANKAPAAMPSGHEHGAATAPPASARADGGAPAALPPGFATVEVSPGRQQLLGIATIPVRRRSFAKGVRTIGIVQADETRTAHVHVKYEGFIEKIFINYTGRAVRKGQPLFRIFSRELLAAQQEYLSSRAALGRVPPAGGDAVRAAAGQFVNASRERLRLFDVPASVLERIERTGVAERAMTVVSPLSGNVIEKQAIEGLAVTPMAHLYVISDLSRVWVVADVYERDLAQVAVGQKARMNLDAFPGRAFEGVLSFVSPVLDESTRTVKVRFEFANPEGALRPGMYATAEIAGESHEGLTVPSDSIIDTGERKIVFVAQGPGRFAPRAVKTGAALGNEYEVVEGLVQGEIIAATGQFLLDSESRIRGARSGGKAPAHGGH